MNRGILFLNVNTRFSHSSLAVPYMLAYLRKKLPEFCYDFIETDIHSSHEDIATAVLKYSPAVLAVSCYLWNMPYYRKLLEVIRAVDDNIMIVAGGPEVSFQPSRYSGLFDSIICGEGEIPFFYLLSGKKHAPYLFDPCENNATEPFETDDLCALPSPFLTETYDLCRRGFVFYESSRGCVWDCSYCVSSNSRNVRYFPLDRVFEELDFLMASDVKSIRFIDRTFNYDDQRSCAIIEYILENNTGKHFQFEIRPELISDVLIQLLKDASPGEIQFEIGLQSMKNNVLKKVSRSAELEKVRRNLKTLDRKTEVHMHLDLISGLPGDDLKGFLESVNRVYAMGGDTIQVGRLKVLPGTRIREEESIYFSRFPPYEVISTGEMSYEDIFFIDRLSRLVQILYNDGKFENTIRFLVEQKSSFSELFSDLTRYWLKAGLLWSRIGFKKLTSYLLEYINSQMTEVKTIAGELLRIDFYLVSKGEFVFDSRRTEKIRKHHVRKRPVIRMETLLHPGKSLKHVFLSPRAAEFMQLPSRHCFIRTSNKKSTASEIVKYEDETERKIMINLVNKLLTVRENSESLDIEFENLLVHLYRLFDKGLINT